VGSEGLLNKIKARAPNPRRIETMLKQLSLSPSMKKANMITKRLYDP
jgi:hypothetical protein